MVPRVPSAVLRKVLSVSVHRGSASASTGFLVSFRAWLKGKCESRRHTVRPDRRRRRARLPAEPVCLAVLLRHSSAVLAVELEPVSQLLPLLIPQLTILIWSSLHRLLKGLPPWWSAALIMFGQLVLTAFADWGTITAAHSLVFASTVLIVLRGPWCWVLFGLTLARDITADEETKSRVLVLTALGRPGVVRDIVATGVHGFLSKGIAIDAVIDTIRRVEAGERVISSTLPASAITAGENPLSEREMAVLRKVAGGASAKDVSSELYMALGTVYNHMSRVLRKLGVCNRIEAIGLARERGWL